MPAVLIDGESVAAKIKKELIVKINELKASRKKGPLLAAVQIGENPASMVYIKNQQKSCEEVGIEYKLHSLPAESTEKQVVEYIQGLNVIDEISGIILQMPLPSGMDTAKVQQVIAAEKDVEGVTYANMGRLLFGNAAIAPCTAMAVIELINSLGIPLKGKEAVVVGHSAIVGKPAALFLLSSATESATTTVCHIATVGLKQHTLRADILIVACGKVGLIRKDMVKPGAIVIDVGINRIPVLDEKGNTVLNEKGKPKMKTVGDVEFDEVKNVAGYITPVPGGVGPVTTVLLLRNTVELFQQQEFVGK
ncbi:MAG: bifunctional 5,10-methylenetetrahydrofolate dehydrogenase/5,10-methenyltetrahydrofolate cyclohydrolase [Elusimicrobiota bacterium]